MEAAKNAWGWFVVGLVFLVLTIVSEKGSLEETRRAILGVQCMSTSAILRLLGDRKAKP